MALAHIRNGQIVQTYSSEKGWVTLASGDRVSPVIEGYTNGADTVVPVVEETVDNSTGSATQRTREDVVEADRVVRRTTISDVPLADQRARAELPRFDFAMATAAAGIVTYEAAAQWAAGNQVPPAVQAVIDAMPAEEQGPAVVDVLARPVIRRSGSMMPALATAYGLTEADLDALFGIGV